jgi:hypothetical protein
MGHEKVVFPGMAEERLATDLDKVWPLKVSLKLYDGIFRLLNNPF